MVNESRMKIVTIVGARPQFIKAAPVSKAFQNNNIQEFFLHTGQHYDQMMSGIFFKELDIPEPALNLEIGSGPHGMQTGNMLIRIEEVLLKEKPELVMVYGDTNTTLAGALTAAKLHIPLAHVEAGLRSFNKKMPEEINRIVTDHVSDMLFCPTQTAVDNLALENIRRGVFVTGDVMFDSFLFHKEMATRKSEILETLGLTENRYTLATVHRAENVDHAAQLKQILSAFDQIAAEDCPLILPEHPRTSDRLKTFDLASGFKNHVQRIPPVSYLDMICLMANARAILTDSGGVQKEAYFAGVPCITLRSETEWPETLSGGWNRLAGANSDAIVEAYHKAISTANRPVEYNFGRGRSGDKIVELILAEI